MNIDAEITCRYTDYGLVCDWSGGKIARLYGEQVMPAALRRDPALKRIVPGEVYEIGRLRLRVVAFPLIGSNGMGSDVAAVMLESPHAQLFWLYRQWAERLVRLAVNVEARIRGFMLKPIQGEIMPFAARLADKLL